MKSRVWKELGSDGGERKVVVFFPLRLQNLHLSKDVGQLGLALAKNLNCRLELITIGAEENLDLPSRVSVYDLTRGRTGNLPLNLMIHLFRYMVARRGEIVLFLSYFWGPWSWISVPMHRALNRGLSIVKLDGNPRRTPGLVNPKYGFVRTWLRNIVLNVFGDSVDLVSCESRELLISMKSSLKTSKIGPRLAVVPSGISDAFLDYARSEPRNTPGPSDHLKILLLGRINEPFKGLEIFLAALQHLQGSRVHFYICGPSGPWSNSMLDNHFSDRPDDRNMVTILPAASGVNEVVDVISSSNVLCLPSFDTPEAAESFGLVLVEAMACGVYCLASDSVPSARDLFGEGKFGQIFRNRDAIDLASQIEKLIKSPSILARAKIEGPQHVAENYTWDILAGQAVALCLESRAGKSLN